MPRPANGYTNAAGDKVPGTHDPISRYMDKSALMHWAHKRGTEGLPLYARDALDIGSTVHSMAELDLRGRPDAEIEKVATDAGLPRDDFDKAMRAFTAFRAWRTQHHVEVIAQETPLVSEAWQYGGTPDVVAVVDGEVALIDFKAAPKAYPDQLVVLAAHAALWNEHNPGRPIAAHHLIVLPKDGTGFQAHAYGNLETQWQLFKLWLEAYRVEKDGCRTIRGTKPAPAPKVAAAAAWAASLPPRADGLDIPPFLRRTAQQPRNDEALAAAGVRCPEFGPVSGKPASGKPPTVMPAPKLRLVASQPAVAAKPKRTRKPKPKTGTTPALPPAPLRRVANASWAMIREFFYVA
jgi:hypothetical protein